MSTQHSNLSDYDMSNVPSGDNLSIGLVVSEWNEDITESLYNGAYDTLVELSLIHI